MKKPRLRLKGLYSAGDMAAVPHNYMLGAFTYGWFAGVNAAQYVNAIEDSELNQKRNRSRKSSNICATGLLRRFTSRTSGI